METLDGQVTVTLAPLTIYHWRLIDQNDFSIEEDGPEASNVDGELGIQLPDRYIKYDAWLALEVLDVDDNIVYLDTVVSARPYADINNLVEEFKITPEQAIEYESVARQLINSIIGYELTFVQKDIHVTGNGTDFIVTDDRIVKINSVTENNIVIWDYTYVNDFPYKPWINLYGIVQEGHGPYDTDIYSPGRHNNRMEHSITWFNRYDSPLFRNGWDYVFNVDAGWPVIPHDIQVAMKMLVNDIKCGNSRYYNKYIDSWKSGTTSIHYMPEVIAGTGNLYVDNILSKYVLGSIRPKVI